MKEVAFITGITGQDGLILAEQLINEDVEIHGTTRKLDFSARRRLTKVNLLEKVKMHEIDLQNEIELRSLLSLVQPTVIFNFGSMSSVGESFKYPALASKSIERPTSHILNWLQEEKSQSVFFNPCSSEMFGDVKDSANENHPFAPKSPYGFAKLNAYNLALKYRVENGINVINGILFNHESYLRQSNFFSKKVISTACQIYNGARVKLEVGNIEGVRDWGWAPDHVRAALTLSRQKKIGDFVVATGIGNSLQSFIEATFSKLGLDWLEHTKVSEREVRTKDIVRSVGNPRKIFEEIGWMPSKYFDELIESLITDELREQNGK